MNDIQSFIPSTVPEPQNTKYPAIFNKLTPPQQNTLNAAIDILSHHRAVLLYEMTGTGKTYVAAALAAVCQKTNACECIVIAPANLLNIWKTVAASFQMNAKFYSYQAASLQTIPAPVHDDALWIIDEAHMLKNPATKRYINLQLLMARHKICLITATPLSMGWQDLNALMVLCGFPHTHVQMDETWLRAFAVALMPQTYAPPLSPDASFTSTHAQIPYIITDETQDFENLIHLLSQIQWFTKTPDGALSDVRLLPHILVHRLLSHRNSCLITLQKLERYYTACRTHSSKQMLSRKEFFHMMGIEGKQQILPFDELVWGSQLDDSDKLQLNHALHNIQLARSMLKKLCSTRDDKLYSLNQYINTHPNHKIVIFTQYADTASYLASALNSSHPAALLTASQSLYKSYPVDPEILLAMFDPNLKLPKWWHETGQPESRILICSDAFSCGHNFQKADTLIHFDLPWNPTTIKQREGRLLRKGQRHDAIQIHHMTLANAPHLVKSYQQSLKNRLTAREQLQNQWFKITPLPADQFLFANSSGIPRIWARNNDFWIPVSSHSLPASAKYMQLQPSTLAEAFEITFHHLRPKYENLFKFIKQYSHHPAIRNGRKMVFKAFYDMALFPQLQVNEFRKQKFTYSTPNRLCMKINAMPVESIPAPNTPCWKTTLYPQEAVAIAQDTHKLSTGYSTKKPSISPVFGVNTESST